MLTQSKDDDKEKWKNSRREACFTLSIESIHAGDEKGLEFQILY